jgi:hypothetical protein
VYHRRVRTLGLAGLLLASLTACTVHLVSDYDDQIDLGLTQANTDITAFVVKMTDEAGTPDGTYNNNKDFYISEKAKLGSIRVRAEAHRALNSCPTTAMINNAVIANMPQQPPSGPVPAMTPQEVLKKLPQDDCEVVLISLIQDAFGDLETFHMAQGQKGIPPSARDPILVGGLGSLIHSAIQVEVAMKAGKSLGGS